MLTVIKEAKAIVLEILIDYDILLGRGHDLVGVERLSNHHHTY